MRKLPRRTDAHLQSILDEMDALMIVERHTTMAARALSEVSWKVYELRRGLAKEIRAQGGSWAEVGRTMGISRQSARAQWRTVDGELGLQDEDREPEAVAPRAPKEWYPDTEVPSHPLWT